MRGQPKKLSFISTASAVTECDSQEIGYEGMVGEHPAPFFGGYAMSKWVSERLMEQAFARGMSGMIMRPGNIFANRETGISSPITSNFALLMMRAYLDSGLAPDLDLVFEAVPVDQLAEAVVACTLSDCENSILNLSNPLEIQLPDYVELLNKITGKKVQIIPFTDWKQRVIVPLKETSPLYPLTLYFQDTQVKEIVRFQTALAQHELKRRDIVYPGDYEKLLAGVFDKTLRAALGII